MTTHRTDDWLSRDLPVLRAVAGLDLARPGHHDVATVATRSGLRREEVLEALLSLEALSALRVERVRGQEPMVGHVTAIGSTLLAMQDDELAG